MLKKILGFFFVTLLIVVIGACSSNLSTTGAGQDIREYTFDGKTITYEIKDGLAVVEGDIVLGEADKLEELALASQLVLQGNFKGASCWWIWCSSPYAWSGVIPYEIQSGMPTNKRNRILSAINVWNASSPIDLVVKTSSHNDYVRFVNSSSYCDSQVGKQGGRQDIRVDNNACNTWGNVMHEIGHAAGLYHEQVRLDRDNHVVILWGNISSSNHYLFQTSNYSDGSTFNNYDYDSIMHYPAWAFSNFQTECNNGQLTKCSIMTYPTSGVSIGQRTHLSSGDLSTLNSIY